MCSDYRASLPSQDHGCDRASRVCATPRPGWFDQANFADFSLPELLEDPMIRLLMSSDGVDSGELRALIADLRSRLADDRKAPRRADRI